MSCEKINYEEKLKRNGIENLPHGRAIVEKENEYGIPKKIVYTGYLEPKGGWLHIYEDKGKVFSIPRERVMIEWDEKWKEKEL